jgi:hypothetical protein
MSWAWDSNVREAMERDRREDDRFLRLYVEGEAMPLSRGPTQLALRLRGLTERYSRFATESRVQAEGGLELLRRLARSSSVWEARDSRDASTPTAPSATTAGAH